MTSASRSKGEDVAAVAGSLTEAQATAVRMWSVHEPRILGGYGLKWAHAHLVEATGVNHPVFGCHYRLTDLGIAVRAHLTDQEGQNR